MTKDLQIPTPIANYVKAINEQNTDAFLATFNDNAIVTDEGHEYNGIATIKKWSDEKNIGAKITLKPIDVTERAGKTVLTAIVDGEFDKTGLPDPFLMDLYFTLNENQITRLNYRLTGE